MIYLDNAATTFPKPEAVYAAMDSYARTSAVNAGRGAYRAAREAGRMIRETREEAGLTVLPETVKEYGYVHRIQKSDHSSAECFVQDNYYFLCEAMEHTVSQDLDEYEAKESYRLEYIDPDTAIRKNREVQNSPYNTMMFEREARVLELLKSEGFL